MSRCPRTAPSINPARGDPGRFWRAGPWYAVHHKELCHQPPCRDFITRAFLRRTEHCPKTPAHLTHPLCTCPCGRALLGVYMTLTGWSDREYKPGLPPVVRDGSPGCLLSVCGVRHGDIRWDVRRRWFTVEFAPRRGRGSVRGWYRRRLFWVAGVCSNWSCRSGRREYTRRPTRRPPPPSRGSDQREALRQVGGSPGASHRATWSVDPRNPAAASGRPGNVAAEGVRTDGVRRVRRPHGPVRGRPIAYRRARSGLSPAERRKRKKLDDPCGGSV